MASTARAHLESLLRARKLDGTLADAHPLAPGTPEPAPSSVDPLDARLGGGWPRGQVSELVGPRSSGRTWLVIRSLVAATRRGELAALVDTLDGFDPASAAALAPVWPAFLWVRGRAPSFASQARGRDRVSASDAMDRAVDRALKAAALVIQAGGFGLVALDFGDVPPPVLRRLPFTTWLRLQRAIEGRDTAALIVAPEPLGRSARGITVRLSAADEVAGRWQGHHACGRHLRGLQTRGRIGRTRWQAADDEVFAIA
jgi:hypothetical protein